VDKIAKIAKDRGVGVIVCGMPVNFDGSESIQTIKTREFIEALKQKTDIPIELEDERFTTMQAREVQVQGGVKRGDRKKSIDSIAASYILDGYLSRMKKREAEERLAEEENQQFKKEAWVNPRRRIMNEKETMNEEYEEEHVIEIEDESGYVEKFLHIGTLEYRGEWYCFFQKAEPETEEEEDEVVMFWLKEEDGEQRLFPLEDEQLMDEVFAEFCHQFEDFEDSDEAMRLDGDEEDE
jgi:putative Holliday junction resolvase